MRCALVASLLVSVGALSPFDRFASEVVAPRFFAWFSSSQAVSDLHQKHVDSETVQHMVKGSPLASAPDEKKLDFARSAAGAAVADFMRLEQRNIGGWKVERIVEAAGDPYDATAERERLQREATSEKVVVFSFIDCPWCLLAKERLAAIAQSDAEPWLSPNDLRIVELEDLGRDGKRLRAALALATGRTSMPSIWVGGKCIGGYTDGDMPEGDPALCVEASAGLEGLTEDGPGRLRELLQQQD